MKTIAIYRRKKFNRKKFSPVFLSYTILSDRLVILPLQELTAIMEKPSENPDDSENRSKLAQPPISSTVSAGKKSSDS